MLKRGFLFGSPCLQAGRSARSKRRIYFLQKKDNCLFPLSKKRDGEAGVFKWKEGGRDGDLRREGEALARNR
ncbi:MAG: hypothetical protein ABIE14_04420 [Patescibacteria group bacterium]